jgi:DNA-binding transcriptional MerR regulator
MMTPAPTFSLEELSAEVARQLAARGLLGAAPDPRVSAAPDARTVRYYTTLGLLDRPSIVSRQARYSQRHLAQLLAIKALQAASLPLADIQARLFGRSDAELQALVASLSAAAAQRPQIKRGPAALKLREVPLLPGLRLLVEDGFKVDDVDALLERVRATLAAIEQD